ncbi:PDZ domain-containing protein [Chlamydia trachomatis]|uniref:Peptidase S41 n=2 Tax=Chlamydia muridarum TaxID=83560 RepID=A0A069ZT31_CHLMR|nr:S41 family peptidase [Chlamydia muridarum]UFT35875.1 PDZ domain-containing protein [Chlamydia trachomatis]AAF39535.1 tail specific protease precursor, putative [Chlamydia muridarum str. Nigg]AHH23110.1 peptidase S41 [Chlamydia muridarum str. Nigg3 CMUT3-5]AHH24035.1 peptidase S41 [Chlamydia muridarum str. Nigg CM972]AID38240.1 peptidase S41 [Chlamydia muridarum str. Nigg 2 MCR]
MKRLARFCLLALTLFPQLAFSSAPLRQQDVRKTVEKLVEHHIDTKHISPHILSRSLEDYARSFDSHKAYLTQDEVLTYVFSEKATHSLFKQYQEDNFASFRELHTCIQQSISRVREWRTVWLSDAVRVIQDASSHTIPKKPTTWGSSIEEVKQRQYELLLSYASIYLEDATKNRYQGKEHALVRLCIRQIENHENPYIGINDHGLKMSLEEEANSFHIRIIKSIAHSLDAHTAYFSKEEALSMRAQLEKGMCGIGVVLKEDIDGVVVKEVLPGGPADKTGSLRVGDIIYRVNGKNIENTPFPGVLDSLRGLPGSSVTLDIHRQNNDHVVQLRREKILLDSRRVDVSYEPYGDGIIGKITLHSFYEGENQISSEQDLRRAIRELQEKNLLGLVLDIRENTGGFLSQAIKVSGLFLTNGVVVVSRYADGSVKRYRTISPQKFYDGPLAVLVSKSSASAAEIVAQTLQDYGVALIVGDKQTYGKGTIQHQTITGNNSQEDFFKVTVGRYYSPSGKSTQLEGVKSDIVIPSRYAEDNLGERFLEYALPADQYENVLNDNLGDLDIHIRPWFQKYYSPHLQKTELTWREMLPQLVENSQQRLEKNKNFEIFVQHLKKTDKQEQSFGSNDLQMEETVNIVKDMILLQTSLRSPAQ